MGSGSDQRNRAMAMRAAKLRRDRATYREIAKLIEVRPEQVKGLILLGERLLSVKEGGEHG